MSGVIDFVNTALSQVGDNGNACLEWYYGEIKDVDWCAIWVSYVGYLSGNESLIGKYALAGDIAEYGDGTKGEYLSRTATPQYGDLIHFIWQQRPTESKYSADHIGIVYKVENNTVYTVEGNSTGGVVAVNEYPLDSTQIVYYFRPFWSDVPPTPTPTPKRRNLPIWMYPKFF